MKLSNQPPKGTSDWEPVEYRIRKYIFDTWRKTCQQYGYEEYLTPILENADMYRAKSGEDLGGKELMTMVDQAGRELAIRPEMTPSVTRMVTKSYEGTPKPIRLFSIANFFRNEKPQRGRNREFWQLNYDIFGSDSINADIEVLQMALDMMLKFSPPQGAFTMYINSRKLIDAVLNDIVGVSKESRVEVVRVLDKWDKLSPDALRVRFSELGLDSEQIDQLEKFMRAESREQLLSGLPELESNEGLRELGLIMDRLTELGYSEWIVFQPNVIRGFDYYDGMVFEVFDNNPENNRSLFGGGRYNGLASIFGKKSFPAVGCAPGDETLKLFLESWGLIPEKVLNSDTEYYAPLLAEGTDMQISRIVSDLRSKGFNIEQGIEVQKINKALDYANKKGIQKVIILGENELAAGKYLIKDLFTGIQTEETL